jgi:hypothetical protein
LASASDTSLSLSVEDKPPGVSPASECICETIFVHFSSHDQLF